MRLFGRTQPWFKMVSANPEAHKHMIATNLAWFCKANEIYLRFPRILNAMINNGCFRKLDVKLARLASPVHYLRRMDEIASLLEKNEFTKDAYSRRYELLENETSYWPARQSFQLTNARQERIYLRPETGTLDNPFLFPETVSYSHYLNPTIL